MFMASRGGGEVMFSFLHSGSCFPNFVPKPSDGGHRIHSVSALLVVCSLYRYLHSEFAISPVVRGNALKKDFVTRKLIPSLVWTDTAQSLTFRV